VLVGTNASGFPNVTTRAYGFAADGSARFLSTATVKQDGATVTATTQPEPASGGSVLSCMVMVDASASVDIGTPSNLSLMKSAASAVPSVLNSVSDEIALGMFDARPTLLYGLSTDKAGYTTAVADINKGSGCNLDSALMGQPEGAMSHLRSARYNRMLLLVLDGGPTFNAQAAVKTAVGFRIPVYIIGVRTKLTEDLRNLADSSGGLYVEQLSTDADAQAYARAFVSHAKGLPATLIQFTSPASCQTTHFLDITSGTTTRSTTYNTPSLAIAELEWSEPGGVDFGTNSNVAERTVTLAARAAAVTINSVTSDDAKFFLTSTIQPGTVLQEDQSIQVKIGYAGGSDGAYGHLNIASNACISPSLALRAGGYNTGESLSLVSPNGGERLRAGKSAAITWTNVLPSDVVRLEYSTDNGSSWKPITETASQLTYEWRPGPELTTSAKVRVQRTAVAQEAVITMAGHRGPVYSAAFTSDGTSLVTGGDDGTVRLWNAVTGEQQRELGSYGEVFAWAVAAHKSQRFAASGGHDGDVSVYDLGTGNRVASFSSSRIWSIDFAPDGQLLAFGTDKAITIVNWRTGDLVNNIAIEGGPVTSVRYSADGTQFITAEGDRVVVRNAQNFTVIRTILTGQQQVYAADISPDKQVIASGGADFRVRTWDANTGNLLNTSPTYIAAITCIDFAPSGARFVAASGDGSAKVFKTTSLELLNSFTSGPNFLYNASFDATGNRLATGGTDGYARVWNLLGATLSEDASDNSFSIVGGTPGITDVNHGQIKLGDGVERRSSVVRNNGSDSLEITGWRMVSGDLTDFDVLSPSQPQVLAPGESIVIETVCSPTEVADKQASLLIEAGGGTTTAKLTGTGISQPLIVPNVVNFGRRIAGQTVVDTIVSLRTPGNGASVAVRSIRLAGVQQAPFEITSGGDPFTLGPGQSHSMGLRFTPSAFGRFAAWIELELGDGTTRIVRLYGEGTGDARAATSTQSLLYKTDMCSSAPVTEQFTMRNVGTSQLVIFNVDVTGANFGEFTILEPTTFPVTLAGQEQQTFRIRFTPTSVGEKEASAVVSSNAVDAANGTTTVQLIARKDSVGFDLSRSKVFFENINEGETAEQRVTIFNTGSTTLRWPITGTDLGAFRIDAANPPFTPVGGSSEVTIRFKGGTVGSTYKQTYTFKDTVCNRTEDLEIEATVRSYIGVTVSADKLGTTIGTSVSVPIRISNKVNFDKTQITELHARMHVNGSILTPTGLQSTFTPEGRREFEVTLPIPQSGDVSLTLNFNTTWGNDTASAVTFDSVWSNDTVVIKTQDGQVALTDLCREGGPRLLLRERDRNGVAGLRRAADVAVIPQPAHDAATVALHVVEEGPTRVELVDATGRILAVIVERELAIGDYLLTLEADKLENGTYRLLLVTRTQRMSHPFTVVR
jgi:WD40 repeat protein